MKNNAHFDDKDKDRHYAYISSTPQQVNGTADASNRQEKTIVARGYERQALLLRQFVLCGEGEVIEVISYLLLLQDVIEDELFVGGSNEEMFVV